MIMSIHFKEHTSEMCSYCFCSLGDKNENLCLVLRPLGIILASMYWDRKNLSGGHGNRAPTWTSDPRALLSHWGNPQISKLTTTLTAPKYLCLPQKSWHDDPMQKGAAADAQAGGLLPHNLQRAPTKWRRRPLLTAE